MTDEERQRQMDFILEQQAQFSTNIGRLQEQQAQLSATVQILVEVVKTQSERMDSADQRLNQFMESSSARMSQSDEKMDRLVETVDRYITARGNGSNGTGGA